MTRLVVGFYPYREGVAMGNLKWPGRFPMRGGKFPKDHPASPTAGYFAAGQMGKSPEMLAFRVRGYWISCFPEGDGITWKPERGQSDERALADVRACFPNWRVIERGEFQPLLDEWEREEAARERKQRRAFVEAKERARTGKCSHIIKYGVYCNDAIGHQGKHTYTAPPPPPPPAKRKCCSKCGEWLDDGGHQCGRGASA